MTLPHDKANDTGHTRIAQTHNDKPNEKVLTEINKDDTNRIDKAVEDKINNANALLRLFKEEDQKRGHVQALENRRKRTQDESLAR